MKTIRSFAILGMLALLVASQSACDNNDPQAQDIPTSPDDPIPGQDSFISADGAGDDGRFGEEGAEDEDAGGEGEGEDKTVEEGDIYRLYGEGLLLNLNYYRGLQVIDIADPDHPTILGRYAVSGDPVEMYVIGNKAVLLLNNWQAYYGAGNDLDVGYYSGGLVVTVDLSNTSAPKLVAQAEVPGWIMTSRLTRGSGHQALYVAASNWSGASDQTVVQSFEIGTNGSIVEQSLLELGGWVQDIAATTDYLMVARYSYDYENYDYDTSTVSIIDISDVTGKMIEGAQIQAAGYVSKKTNMDVYKGILRVASGAWWSGVNENHLQTFNIADIDNPVPVSHLTFGENEQLFATLFLENKAFCVTYMQTDPFHAFEIDDAGNATERAEFVISGWNDWFRPVMDDSRLIGIGRNDTNGWTVAVSLYDITDISNPNPFLARAEVDAQHAWSEASWDDKAFSVIEDAASVAAPGGELETGLVLLPFSGWDDENNTYSAGVQIFTFSASTLTRRGLMTQGSFVRRSFLANPSTTANLSDSELKLFNTENPDAPATLGSVALAPSYNDFFVFGKYGARLVDETADYWYWGVDKVLPPNRVEIVPLSGDLETNSPVASILVPALARLHKVGDLLVSVNGRWVGNDNSKFETTVIAYDLSNPLAPAKKGQLVTEDLPNGYFGGYSEDCWGWWGCGGGYSFTFSNVHVVGEALAFVGGSSHEKTLGTYRTCWTYPKESNGNCTQGEEPGSSGGGDVATAEADPGAPPPDEDQCTYYSGSVTCTSYNGGPQACSGEIYVCEFDKLTGSYSNCTEVDPKSIPTETHCYDGTDVRYWTSYYVSVVDLSDPASPTLEPTISMPSDQESTGVLARGNSLYLGHRKPVTLDGDAHKYARYYFNEIDLSRPDKPVVGPAINVPGTLLEVEADTIYTRDFSYGEHVVETALNKLRVDGDRAVLEARRRFEDREVQNAQFDGAGHFVVIHRQSWYAYAPDYDWEEGNILSIIDVDDEKMASLSDFQLAAWSDLRGIEAGRAMFSVSGGVLVVNLEKPAAPFVQAFYPLRGWPSRMLLEGNDIIVPAGRFGLYRFDLDETNLTETIEFSK
ncbi:MAG: beta-propeller domain-containing protein [Myxococcota bacterium]|nr:beta-propeller domain-containing protein [Myxococcota bacterium]